MKDTQTGVAGDAETSWERRDRLNREAREIVRRLAEPDNLSLSEMEAVIRDAVILWSKMLKGGGR